MAKKTTGGGLRNMFQNLKTGFNNNFGYSFRSPDSTGWGSNLTTGTAKGPGITAFGKPFGLPVRTGINKTYKPIFFLIIISKATAFVINLIKISNLENFFLRYNIVEKNITI